MTLYTRHGTSRAGDDYQDLWGAEILIEFLEHPERYQWVRFEADEAGYLDDILALRTDDRYVARQIKFTVDPEDPNHEVNWHYLLERKPGKLGLPPSLLQKWANSFDKIKRIGNVEEAALYTNRQPSSEFETLLSQDGSGLLNFDIISDPQLRKEICDQLGGTDAAKEFFSVFRFYVDKPEPYTLEDGLKRRFFGLGGNEHGWLNLMSEIRSWAKFKDRPYLEGKITYQILRHAALWHQLKELTQTFEVPADYVLPSDDFHQEFIKVIKEQTDSCLVLWGSPGNGKSTYLSYLVTKLREEGIPVVRHHYFLSLTDRSGDRFNHRIVAESIMQQIEKRYSEALGHLANRNPNPNDLGKWFENCGRHFAGRGLPFVVIVDGLDHVWRERQSVEEMTLLFELLLPPPDGVVIIIGTQKVAPAQLPQLLLDSVHQNKWWQLPTLSAIAIKRWLEFRSDMLGLPDDPRGQDYLLADLANAFFEISQGHPLHLKYSFEALIKQGSLIREHTIRALPSCPEGDIERYYQQLWNSLQEKGKQMLHLLAACVFPWPREGLVNCLSNDPAHDDDVMNAERHISHLLQWNEVGATAFHPSLLVFIKRQPDHETYAVRLRPKVLDWLVNKAPEYWRWAYEWIVRADAGDPSALRDNPTQSWVIEAITIGRPIEGIIDILQRAAWLALDNRDLSRVLELNTLWEYVANSRFEEETFERLLYCQLRLNEDEYLYRWLLANFGNLSDGELVVFSESVKQSGPTTIPQQCLEEFRRRVRETYELGDRQNRRPESDVARNLNLAAIAGISDLKRILKFIEENRSHDIGQDAFLVYCRRLAALRDTEALRNLFEYKLDDNDTYDLVTAGVRIACEEKIDLIQWIKKPRVQRVSLLLCYQCLCDNPPPANLFFETPDIDQLDQKEYDLIGPRMDLVRFFHEVFFSSMALALYTNGNYSDLWLHCAPRQTWVERFCCFLTELAAKCGKQLLEGEIPSYSWLYRAVRDFSPPEWDEDRTTRRFYLYVTHALIEIALDLHLLCSLAGGPTRISLSDIQNVVASSYWNREIWLEQYIDNKRQLLADDALEWLLDWEQGRLAQTVNELNERAVAYARLAQIAVLHGAKFFEKTKIFLRKAANCLIGYGNHSDASLYETLDIVEACHKAGIGQTTKWVTDLSPMINAIADFTDGHESSHLPIEFSRTVLTVRPALFFAYYYQLVDKEEWSNAEGAFRAFIEIADLGNPVAQAVVRTVVDTGGLWVLKKRADSEDLDAREAFTAQEQSLGGINFKEDISSNSTTFQSHEKIRPPSPEDYPPEQLRKYIDVLNDAHLGYRSELITKWFDCWAGTQHAEKLLKNITDLSSLERYQIIIDVLFDKVFELCLSLRGLSAAYSWIVKAHRARYGWSKFHTSEDEIMGRFKRFAELYSDKWFSFIRDTAEPRFGYDRIGHIPAVGFSRLVRFCLIVEQIKIAEKVAETAVRITLERTADLPLPTPNWILEDVD